MVFSSLFTLDLGTQLPPMSDLIGGVSIGRVTLETAS
jgi:hypothetical protein